MTLTVRILTAYGGLLPIATMLDKLGFQQLVEEALTAKRATRAMSMYQFVLAMVLAIWRHAGRAGVSYSDHYAEQGIFQRLMNRLRGIVEGPQGFVRVIAVALRL